jgi:hypothetical protein
VGHYELIISAIRFATKRKTNLTVDTDSALRVDAKLTVATRSDFVTVISDTGVQVETAATHLGEVVSVEWKELHGPLGNSTGSDLNRTAFFFSGRAR